MKRVSVVQLAPLDPNHNQNLDMANLPVETWLDISSQTCFKRKELLSLIVVNRFFYDIFIRRLYANVRIRLPFIGSRQPSSKFSSAGPVGKAFLDKLESDKQLQGYIHHFRIEGRVLCIQISEEFMASLMTLVGDLPNLKIIDLASLSFPMKWMRYIASRPNLRLAINMSRCEPHGSAKHSESYTVVELNIRYGICISYIAFGGSLQCLKLPDYPIYELMGWYISLERPVLVLLRHLEVRAFRPELISLLRNTPGLTTLQFSSYQKLLQVNPESWKDIVPNLESFSGHESLIPLFVIGRPITSIRTWAFRGGISLQSLGEQVGSTAPLHEIILEYSDFLDEFLDEILEYVTKYCPQVRELSIWPGHRVALTKDEIISSLNRISNLKKLRKLSFPDTRHVSRQDEWEKERCEALRAEGCKDIIQINFSGQSWTRHPDDSTWKKRLEE